MPDLLEQLATSRPANIGDVIVGQSMMPQGGPNAPGLAPDSNAPDRTLAANSSTFVPLKAANPNDKDAVELVDLFNRHLANGQSIDEISPSTIAAISNAVTGDNKINDDVINQNPELFYQLKFRQGKYEPQLLDDLGKPGTGWWNIASNFLMAPVDAVKNVVVGGVQSLQQDLAGKNILAGNIATLSSGLTSARQEIQNLGWFGPQDIVADLSNRLQRIGQQNPAAIEKLDRQQSELIRQRVLRGQSQQAEVNNAEQFAGDLLVNAGLSDLGNAVKQIQLTPEQQGVAALAADPINFLSFGLGKAVAEGTVAKAGVRSIRFAEADAAFQAAQDNAINLATHRMGFQSLIDEPRATAADRQIAQKGLARLAPLEADAQRAVAATGAERAAALDGVNQEMTNASKPSFVRNAAGKLMQVAGTGGELVGKAADWVESIPGQIVDRILPEADTAAKQAAQDLVKRYVMPAITGHLVAGPVGAAIGVAAPFLTDVGRAAMRDLTMAGEQLSLGQQTLPFWRAVKENSSGLPKAFASMLDNQLVYAIPDTTRGAAAGALFGGVTGYIGSGGTTAGTAGGAGTGGIFGAAGSGLGQLKRFNSPAELHTASIGDRATFIKSLNPANQTMFGLLPPSEQLGISVYARVHPDLDINFISDKNAPNGNHQVIGDRAVATINVQGDNPLQSILQHEIGHHVAAHGLTGEVDRYMLGDVGLQQPGIFSKLGPDGKPLVEVTNGVAHYVPDETFEAYKAKYNRNLTKGDPTAVPENDHGIAQEMFAELHAASLTDPALVQKMVRGYVPSALLSDAAISNWLTRVGVGADPVTGRSIITDTVAKTRGLNDVITEFYRQRNYKNLSPEDPTGSTRVPVTEARQGTPEFERLQKTFDASGDLRRNPDGTIWTDAAGRPQVLSTREVDAAQGRMADQAIDALRRSPQGAAGGHEDVLRLKTHRDGRQYFRGQYVPQDVFDALTASNQHNASQVLNWQKLNGIMDRNDGTMVTLVYNTAGNRGAYATLPARSRAAVPIQTEISPKIRQVNIKSYDPEQLVENITKYLKTKKGKDLWDGKIATANDDAKTYLDNLANGRPGETGLGLDKKAALNQLFGFPDSGANPTIADLAKRSPSVIKSFRIDRINQLQELPGVTRPFHRETYEQVRAYQQPRGMGEAEGMTTLYRGESGGEGHFFSTDKEWARQFTHSGRDAEIVTRQIRSDDIHQPAKSVAANDPEAVDQAIAEAKQLGKKAVRLSEGRGQPDSIFIIDPKAIRGRIFQQPRGMGEKAIIAPSSVSPAPVVVPPEKPVTTSEKLSRQEILEAADQLDIKPAKLRDVLRYAQEHNLV